VKKIFRPLLAIILVQSILCADALAIQSTQPAQPKQVIKISNLLTKLGSGEEALIAVRLKDKSVYKGYVAEVERDSFRVVDTQTGESNRVSMAQISRMQGVNLMTGVQVSHGVGIRAKLAKALAVVLPGPRVQQKNGLFGTTALLVGIVIGIILAIVLAKNL
jgi:hypothetical protein